MTDESETKEIDRTVVRSFAVALDPEESVQEDIEAHSCANDSDKVATGTSVTDISGCALDRDTVVQTTRIARCRELQVPQNIQEKPIVHFFEFFPRGDKHQRMENESFRAPLYED